ncbi:hypothetical protein C7974DRAFT_228157 [Boeremia exigua]|uniref:uncharacterized protein n=1 Tax=Boeremia exigua TaxID=749465 RepID=UPI001E8D2077|nr:uncharacterized protein C7974DRAFT_228157 [Boeremia exigua]KAH6620223.1 hypothetical protein C7974DRAFT_228157 [Boeremia exigua]
MGWLWSSSNESDKLDPSLRDFLKKESPTGPKPALPTAPKEQPVQSTPAPAPPTQAPAESEKPFIPPQSQFQDGRYAHLWKGYVPQDVLLERGKNEQDKLKDLVDAYNGRNASIAQVAIENCAIEQIEQFECFRNPKQWFTLGGLCNAESRKFNRCYDMQSKFLRALGYLTIEARTPDQDEKIQMHADKLYQQMLRQEAEIEKAEKEGREPPKFESVLSKANIARAMAGKQTTITPLAAKGSAELETEEEIWSLINPEARKQYQDTIARLPPKDQEIERMAILGELKAQQGMTKQIEKTFIEERVQRMKRKEAGQATIGDTIKSWWGWG